ncbi:MAG: hypothetical protein IPP62_12615 [bacterium]|nr:hypothetical protein [bacterium]
MRPNTSRAAAVVALALAVILGGCGGTTPAPGEGTAAKRPAIDAPDDVAARERWSAGVARMAARRDDCRLDADPVAPGGNFVVSLTDSVRPRLAPVPRNRAERLVFSQLYETLVRIDCEGAASPGLAVHWSCGADSTVWVFTLREDARTWDGERLTAVDVWRSWQENCAAPVDDGASPWQWFDPRTGSVSVLDARRLTVRLPEPQRLFPLLLAHPATAVAVRKPGWAWPVGSGPCRLTPADGAPRPVLTCRPHQEHPRAPDWETLAFRVTPGRDPFEAATAADAGPVDLLWTRDLEAVHRFEALPDWRVQPLPWNRVHLLVCPPALDRAQAALWFTAAEGLAPESDVQQVSARDWPALTVPVADRQACPQLSGPVAADRGELVDALSAALAAGPATVVFPQDDPAAGELAGRLAELAGPEARAVPLPPGAAAAALRRGEACASVVPVPQSYADGCLQMAALLGRAAWLQRAGLVGGNAAGIDAALRAAQIATPLAVTRAWLVTRSGPEGAPGGITLDFDACPDLARLGRVATASKH